MSEILTYNGRMLPITGAEVWEVLKTNQIERTQYSSRHVYANVSFQDILART